MSEPVVSLAQVTKTYRRRTRPRAGTLKSALLGIGKSRGTVESLTALDRVDLSVGRGESVGVIGGNGSGKSTLLKLVAGILRPTSGSLVVNGRVSALLELGAGFHPEISGRENVVINGVMLGLSKKEVLRRFDEIVEFAGIADFIDEPVKNYSSGMYVRLGFAVAVHTDPDVLLVDEVLAVGDEEFSHRCLARIREMQAAGKTILFVTHALGLVVDLCDRAVWLRHGKVAASGEPREVVDRYRLDVASEERAEAARRSGEAALPDRSEAPAPSFVAAERGDAPPDGDPRKPGRWGDGSVAIRALRLENAPGSATSAFDAGSRLDVVLELEPTRPLTDFVVGIGLFDKSGTCIHGTNTDLEGFVPVRLGGRSTVRITLDPLDLVPGDYDLDVAVHARDGRPYDYVRGAASFHVAALPREVGIWRPRRKWSFEGGIEVRRG